MVDTLYFDNNASTFIDPAVHARMLELYGLKLGNPASQHRSGRAALRFLEQAKSDLLRLLDAPADGMDTAVLVLTSGGTEANNLAILGLSALRPTLVCAIEHASVLESASRRQPAVGRLPVDQAGVICLDRLEQSLRAAVTPPLVSVMLGNNETGIVQDLRLICELCHRYGAIVHSDIVQAAGKIDFSMLSSGVDAVTLTAHKIHGPVGVGALVVRPGLAIDPLLFGGGQQLEIRPGTEPVVLADAFALALQLTVQAQQSGAYSQLAELRQRFESQVLAELGDVFIVSAAGPRLPHTSQLAFLGVDRQALLIALDLAGLACSTGSACASGSGRPSHVLQAMALPDDVIRGSLRFSFSRFTTSEELDTGAELLVRTVRKLRG